MPIQYEVYKDVKGEFRWRLVTSNGQTIATGGESYKSMEQVKASIKSARRVFKGCESLYNLRAFNKASR
jgi:uncharacterized protein